MKLTTLKQRSLVLHRVWKMVNYVTLNYPSFFVLPGNIPGIEILLLNSNIQFLFHTPSAHFPPHVKKLAASLEIDFDEIACRSPIECLSQDSLSIKECLLLAIAFFRPEFYIPGFRVFFPNPALLAVYYCCLAAQQTHDHENTLSILYQFIALDCLCCIFTTAPSAKYLASRAGDIPAPTLRFVPLIIEYNFYRIKPLRISAEAQRSFDEYVHRMVKQSASLLLTNIEQGAPPQVKLVFLENFYGSPFQLLIENEITRFFQSCLLTFSLWGNKRDLSRDLSRVVQIYKLLSDGGNALWQIPPEAHYLLRCFGAAYQIESPDFLSRILKMITDNPSPSMVEVENYLLEDIIPLLKSYLKNRIGQKDSFYNRFITALENFPQIQEDLTQFIAPLRQRKEKVTRVQHAYCLHFHPPRPYYVAKSHATGPEPHTGNKLTVQP